MSKQSLMKKLASKRPRVNLRYKYYDMKNSTYYQSKLIPSEFRYMLSVIGWCAKAVDSIADRLTFKEFREDIYNSNGVFAKNNPDILFDSIILSTMISSCSFVYIYKEDEDSDVKMQVIDGSNATGTIDESTGLLIEGYAVLERDDNDNVIRDAYFTPESTFIYQDNLEMEIRHNLGYCMLVPVMYRPDAKRPFGHSRISRACMDIVDAVARELLRSEVASEFYSVPQKYVLGLSEEAEFNGARAMYSNFLSLGRDEDGNLPSVGQFNQQTMQPFVEYIKTMASLFAAETGLTVEDLGFQGNNPSSSESIKASHDQLRLTARKAQRNISACLRNVGLTAVCLRDNTHYNRSELMNVECIWDNLFELDVASMGALGDAILKINQANSDVLDKEKINDMLGL